MSWIFKDKPEQQRGIHLHINKSSVKSCGKTRNALNPGLRFPGLALPGGTGIHRIEYHNCCTPLSSSQNLEPGETVKISACPHELSHINRFAPAIIVTSDVFKFIWWPASLLVFMVSPVFSPRSPLLKARHDYKQALANMENREFSAALEGLNALQETKPDLIGLNPDRAICYYQLGLYDEAYECMESYIGRNAKDAGGIIFYAALLLESRSFESATELLQNLSRDKQENVEVINLMAYCRLEMNQPLPALAALEKGPLRKRKLDEGSLIFYNYLLGVTYLRLDQTDRALPRLQKVYSQDPDFMNTAALLQQIQDAQG